MLTWVSQTLVVMICSRSCCREEEKLLRSAPPPPLKPVVLLHHPGSFPHLPKPWELQKNKHKHILAMLTSVAGQRVWDLHSPH